MKKYYSLYFLLTIVWYSCGQNSTNGISTQQPDKNKIAILYPASLLAGKAATPLSAPELAQVDSLLHQCVDSSYNIPNKTTGLRIDLSKYRRQYIPSVNEKGEKVVWVNCFCDDHKTDDWKEKVVYVEDGGNCFFNAIINLGKKNFSQFIVNGKG